MVLDIEDVLIRARRMPINGERVRLTIEYPRTPEYRDKINCALADLLRPVSTAPADALARPGAEPRTAPTTTEEEAPCRDPHAASL